MTLFKNDDTLEIIYKLFQAYSYFFHQNKTEITSTVTSDTNKVPSCAAVSTALSGKLDSGVNTSSSAWSKRADDEEGTQIDLLIIRDDNVINMCELKFYSGEYDVDNKYYKTLMTRESLLQKEVSPKTVIRSTLVTTFGLKKNEYSSVFSNVILMDDLFD